MDDDPKGFGLIQRDRNFADYQDPDSQYERRPSYWIQPLGDWGKGGMELVEIPSDEEIHENIDAYWVPSAPVKPHAPIRFSYLLSAYLDSGEPLAAGRQGGRHPLRDRSCAAPPRCQACGLFSLISPAATSILCCRRSPCMRMCRRMAARSAT